MTGKRKDSRGRVLRNGEVQRSDGKYMFRYTDAEGERRSVYSWKLVETDKIPNGKRCKEALRTIEQRVLKDLDDGISTGIANSVTINAFFTTFMETRTELRPTTRSNYICLYNKHVRYAIGRRVIGSVKYSDIYKFYMSLSTDTGLKVSTIKSINAILWQLFETAEKDNLIRRNPANGAMNDVAKRLKEEPKERHALTIEQQSALLSYVYGNHKYRRYAALITILLGTGMRIGEALGLTWNDVDFKNNCISVTHSLSYKSSEHGGYKYHVSSTKTKAGIRTIPMFQDVRTTLQNEKQKQKRLGKSDFTVDGYTDFIFLNSAGKVFTPSFIFDAIQNMVSDYNRDEIVLSKKEGREPCFLPKISAHIFRHTCCTRLCENEPNLKIIQEVMGHKNICTTMNVYSEATEKAKQASFENLEGKIKLK